VNILIPDVLREPVDIEAEIFGMDADIVVGEATSHEDITDEVWSNCDAILAFDQIIYDKDLISKLVKCKVIVRVGVGYDNVNLLETKKKNIVVCNVPDYGTEEVADHAMGMLLSLLRGLPEYTRRVQQRNYCRENQMPARLGGKNLGIIGLGRIGTATALRAKAFGLKVIFYDPYKDDGYDKSLGIRKVDTLHDLARLSDIVSIHTPLTKETENMIDDSFFKIIKPDSILINTARGSIIDLSALRNAMKKKIIKAAGLDVLPIEPSDDSQQLIVEWENNEEWLRGRLIVTPHVGFYSPEALKEMRIKASIEVKRVLEGKPPQNLVNP
jgi:lactate dehydrogenase-like 2-hydroxyacid dehydrogenase|tara:strand:+ start:403 stop:1383 length:981 start_codon:yes stop_codon:yes gene_type:complete